MQKEDWPARHCIVIGAGPAGLAVMQELKRNGIPFLGIESHDQIGGMWNIRNPQSPAYISLTTNSSKSTTYLDQTAPTSWPDYFSRQRAYQYLNDFTIRHGLSSSIRFNSSVNKVKKLDSGLWNVTCTDQNSGQEKNITAGKLVLCTGTHCKSNKSMPSELLEKFEGSGIDPIHSSQYKDPAPYVGKRVLLLGCGNSAADIATEISILAKSTVLSTRTVPWIIPLWVLGLPADKFRRFASMINIPFPIQNFFFHCLQRIYIGHPENLGLGEVHHDLLDHLPVSDRGLVKAIGQNRIRIYGAIERVDGNTVYFEGKRTTSEEIDNVIFATGYKRDYSFLDEQCKHPLRQEDNTFPLLIFHPVQKDLFFMSEVNVPQGSWPLFTKQAKVIASYLKAEIQPGHNFHFFNNARHKTNPDLKGKIFCAADRYHVDPDIYAKQLDRFCEWIRL